jgi:hypothetical protein
MVGGLSGSSTTNTKSVATGTINSISLILYIRDRTSASRTISFFKAGGAGASSNSPAIQKAMSTFQHWQGVLFQALDAEHGLEGIQQPSGDALSPELRELWTLHKEGALSATEFEREKRRLLAR